MSEQERLREIEKTVSAASAAIASIVDIARTLADKDVVMAELSELSYQLGYIKGLSYVPEEDDDTEQSDR